MKQEAVSPLLVPYSSTDLNANLFCDSKDPGKELGIAVARNVSA